MLRVKNDSRMVSRGLGVEYQMSYIINEPCKSRPAAAG